MCFQVVQLLPIARDAFAVPDYYEGAAMTAHTKVDLETRPDPINGAPRGSEAMYEELPTT